MPLSRHSEGTYQETSSHATCQGTLAEPLLIDSGLASAVSVRKLISTLKKKNGGKKKAQAGTDLSNVLQKSSHARKKPPPLLL